MHSIHTTPGFILDSKPYGEAGKVISIFTRDFGLVTATAQGIRLEKSKLRYFSQDRSFGNFSLVRGKEFWRLTSAQADPERTIRASDTEPIARIVLLLKRLLQGEEAHEGLFDLIAASADFVAKHPELNGEQAKTLETLTVFRILAALGYIGADEGLDEYIAGSELSIELIDKAASGRISMNKHINKALKESHL